MKTTKSPLSWALAVLCAGVLSLSAQVKPGDKAPEFTLTDLDGKSHKLSDFKGKYVVLEWLNHECPFVVGQYKPGLMQKAQADVTGKGAVWLSINSTNPEHGNYKTAEQEKELYKKSGSKATAVLQDADGKVGKAYGATTTPHIFVINPDGVVIYTGAIDNGPKVDDAKRVNYAVLAVEESLAGKPVSTPSTKQYGCGVKYK